MIKLLNIIFATFLLVFLSPLFLLIIVLLFFDDGLPIFFIQKRVGINNSSFRLIKFRTMKKNTPDIPSHLLNDPLKYYTKMGPVLRKLSIDELPQLLNIIRGEMLFVGPRPALYNQEDLIALRKKNNVHNIYPGVTGWAQINGRDSLSIQQKVLLDKFYLDNRSIKLDIKIIVKTFSKVIIQKNVSH